MTIASIDLVILNDLIRRMTDAAGALMSSAGQIKRTSTGVLGGASETATINQVAGWVNDQLPGLRRRLALAQQIENQAITFGQRAAGQRGIVKIDESLLSTLPPDQARALGADAAKQLNGAPGKLSPELIAVLAKNQNDPYFALGFAGNADLKQVSWALRLASRDRERIIAESGPKSPELEQWKVHYTSLVTALGTTLGTATRDLDGVGLPPGFAEKYADAITEGKTRSSTPSDIAHGQGQSLSMLLRYGRFSTRFLDTVSTKVYDYEYARKDDPVWEPRTYWEPYHSFAGAYQPDGKAMPDALANILEALSHNPQAAQNFFDVTNPHAATTTVEINGRKFTVNSRLKYIIQDRTWRYDGGDGLGNALKTATTTWRDRTGEGQVSATIASQSFALFGQNIGFGKSDGGWMGAGSHRGWKPGSAMRDSLAEILASYSPDLIRVTGTGEELKNDFSAGWTAEAPVGFPPGGPFGAAVDAELMRNIISLLGEDPKNLRVVAAGVGAAGQLMYGYTFPKDLKADSFVPVDIINGVGKAPAVSGAAAQLSRTMAYLLAIGIDGKAVADKFEKDRAQNISNAVALALKLPFIPTPSGAWTGLVLDQAKAFALDAIANAPSKTADVEYTSEKLDIERSLKELAVANMLRAGYFDQRYYDLANGNRPDRRQPPPPEAFELGPDRKPIQPLKFNFQSEKFRDWFYRSGMGPSDWAQNTIVNPYASVLVLLAKQRG